MTLRPYSYYTKPEEWQKCYTKLSEDGESPTLCFEDLYGKIAKLEARLDREDSHGHEQND